MISACFYKERSMTITELINKVQEEKPNTFTTEKMISFINELEPEVAEQFLLEECPEYDASSMNTELLAPDPYSRLYVSYLKSQVDYANEEYPSYQLNRDQHVQDFRDFVDWVIRTRQTEEVNTFPRRVINIL